MTYFLPVKQIEDKVQAFSHIFPTARQSGTLIAWRPRSTSKATFFRALGPLSKEIDDVNCDVIEPLNGAIISGSVQGVFIDKLKHGRHSSVVLLQTAGGAFKCDTRDTVVWSSCMLPTVEITTTTTAAVAHKRIYCDMCMLAPQLEIGAKAEVLGRANRSYGKQKFTTGPL